ncbi:type II secretion system secretin GspD [Thermosulfurimonas sp. F29]|uniref:type II secretion system secretin GspD n=1 Tax=Thermosulfurimonas sp. F29 TaxID=2867247 RepID=UPI001C839B1B|nr:type II secretion system secretin GspD [Thermosulfurimonas sp. F29]MBX6424272.1 type II secretion system secretin GspD [Thermosulfurimonas sp. F29]
MSEEDGDDRRKENVGTDKTVPEGKHTVAPPEAPEILSLQKRHYRIASGKPLSVSLDMEGADLLDFLDLILLKTLHLNYAVDPAARAKITAHIKGDFSPEELIEIVRAVLELHALDLVQDGKIWRVIPDRKRGEVGAGPGFLIVRPRYASATSLVLPLKSFVSAQGRILADRQSNILLVVDRDTNLQKVLRVISVLDQARFARFVYRLYPCRVLAAGDLAKYVRESLRSSVLKDSGLYQRVEVIPLEKLDTLLVLAQNEEELQRVWQLLIDLDKGEVREERVYVYQVENGDAEEIARILESVFSKGNVSRRRTVIRARKGKTGISGAGLTGEVRIVPDKANNLLLIRANPDDYRRILRVLKQIDVVPRQVVIETLIAEVTLNKALEYGLEWFLKTNFRLEGRRLEGNAVFSREGRGPFDLGSDVSGFVYTLFRGQSLRALLYALSSVSEVNILSNPVLLATDNRKARIQIGQEVPIITQKVTNTSASIPTVTSNVQYRDTGIILEVKPQINSSGLVKLDIVQEVSTAQKNYLGLESPLFSKRRIETSLVVEDGQTVILGGLIDTRKETGKTGVPVLRRIPLVGKFFEWNTVSRDRTELFVAITPRVVRSRAEAEEVMRNFKRRIRELQEYLREKNSRVHPYEP